jgi:hypothetical protein
MSISDSQVDDNPYEGEYEFYIIKISMILLNWIKEVNDNTKQLHAQQLSAVKTFSLQMFSYMHRMDTTKCWVASLAQWDTWRWPTAAETLC